ADEADPGAAKLCHEAPREQGEWHTEGASTEVVEDAGARNDQGIQLARLPDRVHQTCAPAGQAKRQPVEDSKNPTFRRRKTEGNRRCVEILCDPICRAAMRSADARDLRIRADLSHELEHRLE